MDIKHDKVKAIVSGRKYITKGNTYIVINEFLNDKISVRADNGETRMYSLNDFRYVEKYEFVRVI